VADLRKLVTTDGKKTVFRYAVLRPNLNRTAPKTDVPHRQYLGLIGR
jgi:hypothetical protein